MTRYLSYYDPPQTGDRYIDEYRTEMFDGVDRQMFLHVGHFVSWYASLEFIITFLLHEFSGRPHPVKFDNLIKGMDAKTKVERLRSAIRLSGWETAKPLNDRLDHFCKKLAPLRNKIVHRHLYWPEGDQLQISTLAQPPLFEDVKFEGAAKPDVVEGLLLFEHGIWMAMFSHDLGNLYHNTPRPLPPKGIIGGGNYRSSLPKASRSNPQKPARRAKLDRPAQKPAQKEG